MRYSLRPSVPWYTYWFFFIKQHIHAMMHRTTATAADSEATSSSSELSLVSGGGEYALDSVETTNNPVQSVYGKSEQQTQSASTPVSERTREMLPRGVIVFIGYRPSSLWKSPVTARTYCKARRAGETGRSG